MNSRHAAFVLAVSVLMCGRLPAEILISSSANVMPRLALAGETIAFSIGV
jgi:hypothetical protein